MGKEECPHPPPCAVKSGKCIGASKMISSYPSEKFFCTTCVSATLLLCCIYWLCWHWHTIFYAILYKSRSVILKRFWLKEKFYLSLPWVSSSLIFPFSELPHLSSLSYPFSEPPLLSASPSLSYLLSKLSLSLSFLSSLFPEFPELALLWAIASRS